MQDPATALEPSMPASALAHVQVDHCLPLGQIAQTVLQHLARLPDEAPLPPAPPQRLLREHALADGDAPMTRLPQVASSSPHQAQVGQQHADRLREQARSLVELIESEPGRA